MEKIPINPLLVPNIKEKTLKILIISDIHSAFNMLEKLKNWYFNVNEEQFHYVLIAGDFLNLTENQRDLDVCKQEEGKIASILCYLDCFAVPILYVGGNHDFITLFKPSEEEKLTEKFHY